MAGVKTGAKLVEKLGKIKPRLGGLMHGAGGARQARRFLATSSICVGSSRRHRIKEWQKSQASCIRGARMGLA